MSILPKRTTIDPSTAKERKITARNVKVIGSLLALAGSAIVGPSAFAGQSIRSILGAIKLAPGRVGNIKLADTVGKRIKQAQAIDPKLAKAGWARFGQPGFFKNIPVHNKKGIEVGRVSDNRDIVLIGKDRGLFRWSNVMTKKRGTTSLVGVGKGGRTLQKAVEQGPAKFFSKGRHTKTGVTPGKRKTSDRFVGSFDSPRSFRTGASGGTSKGSLMQPVKHWGYAAKRHVREGKLRLIFDSKNISSSWRYNK